MFLHLGSNGLIRYFSKAILDDFQTLLFRLFSSVVLQVFLERHERIRLTDIRDLSRLDQTHEPVSGTTLPVTCSAEARYMAKIQKPVHYLVESSRIVDIKLCRIIVFSFFFHVTAYTCAAASGDLRNAELNSFASHRLGFSGGHDDTGIRYCDPQDRNDPLENFIRHAVVKGIRIDIIRRTHTRYTDGVRSAAERIFQMLCMHKDAYEIVFIKIEAEQNAAAYIVYPRFHRPVHGLGMIRIIALRTGWVKIFIRFFIICLLEQDVCSDPGVFQLLIILDRRGRDVDVDTADRSVFMFDAVDRIDALQYVFDRVVFRIFPRLDGQPFVSHILQSRDFLTDLLLRQLLSADMLVLSMIRAVLAAIDAVI